MFSKSLVTLAVAALAATQLASAQPHHHKRRHGSLQQRNPSPEIVTVLTTATTVYVDQHSATVYPNANPTDPVTVTVTAPPSPPVVQKPPPIHLPGAPRPVIEDHPKQKPKEEESEEEKPEELVQKPPPIHLPGAPDTEGPKDLGPKQVPKGQVPKREEPKKTNPRGDVSTYGAHSKPGIVWSPYLAGGGCKDLTQVEKEIDQIKEFSPIRLYGVDCNQIENAIKFGKKYGTQVFTGIYNMDKYEEELGTLIKAVGNDWASVHTVAIGNEVVQFTGITPDDYAQRINRSREILRAAKYTGPVVGPDTFVAILANPAICKASDYVAANCHPFFDGGVTAEESGNFLVNMKKELAKVCGDKDIMITEAGWPSQGGTNRRAVPGVENQRAAVRSMVQTQGKNLILFTAFDDPWKQDTPFTFGAEKFWGIKDLSLS